MLELAVAVPVDMPSRWTAAERRTLWAVLGFIAGMAAMGPVSALGTALLGALAARFFR